MSAAPSDHEALRQQAGEAAGAEATPPQPCDAAQGCFAVYREITASEDLDGLVATAEADRQAVLAAPVLAGGPLSLGTVALLLHQGWVIHAALGGLVLGRAHTQGGVYMLQEQQDGMFVFITNLEGGEYIVNHRASQMHRERLTWINNQLNPRFYTGPILTAAPIGTTRVLNTHATPFDRALLIDTRGQFIVNRHATACFFDEIQRLNESGLDVDQVDWAALSFKPSQDSNG